MTEIHRACPACGHEMMPGVAACSRCGMTVTDASTTAPAPEPPAEPPVADAPAAEPPVVEATTNRAALLSPEPATPIADQAPAVAPEQAATVAPEPPYPQQSPPPPPPGYPPPFPGFPPGFPPPAPNPAARGFVPPEVVLVAIALLAVGGLALYPVIRYGFPVLGHLADSNEFSRALAALTTYIFLLVGATGAALVLLAVGLLRGSRVAQLLTCLLCAVLSIAELADQSRSFNVTATNDGLRTGVVVGSIVVALLLLLPGANRFFARDAQRPVGVDLAAAVGLYFGGCAVVSGLLLMLVGAVGAKYVWWGVGVTVFGMGLIFANRLLRAGRNGARVLVTVCYAGYVVLGFVIATKNGDASSASAIIPLGIALIALGGLWLAPSSQHHFGQPRPLGPVNPALVTGAGVLLVVSVVLAGFGFHSAAQAADPYRYSGQAYTPVPTYSYSPSYSAATPSYSGVDESQARSAADDAFRAMSGNGYANTCSGDLPSLSVSDYTIDEVTPQTSGTFYVSAEVTLDDGTTETISVLIGSDSSNDACVEADTLQTTNVQTPASATPSASVPSDVPDVPSSNDPVPSDAALPGPPQADTVLPYDSSDTPTEADQIVEYQPSDLSGDESAAVADLISFMAHINQQDFGAAWDDSTDSLVAAGPSSAFERGFRTSRFYQVAFGQPRQLASDLIVVPGRFVSRQDPASQGNPAGVTECTYWPQYVFVVANVNGQWLDDVAGKYASRRELRHLKRIGSDGGRYLNPVSQRVTC